MADTDQKALAKTNDNIQEVNVVTAQTDIKSLIYVVRNQQVMMDSDLAMLYQVETKRLNEAVKRNIARFPKEFCFQLTAEETESLRSQFATLNKMTVEENIVNTCPMFLQSKESPCYLPFCEVMWLYK